jgi:hypothetical protein
MDRPLLHQRPPAFGSLKSRPLLPRLTFTRAQGVAGEARSARPSVDGGHVGAPGLPANGQLSVGALRNHAVDSAALLTAVSSSAAKHGLNGIMTGGEELVAKAEAAVAAASSAAVRATAASEGSETATPSARAEALQDSSTRDAALEAATSTGAVELHAAGSGAAAQAAAGEGARGGGLVGTSGSGAVDDLGSEAAAGAPAVLRGPGDLSEIRAEGEGADDPGPRPATPRDGRVDPPAAAERKEPTPLEVLGKMAATAPVAPAAKRPTNDQGPSCCVVS